MASRIDNDTQNESNESKGSMGRIIVKSKIITHHSNSNNESAESDKDSAFLKRYEERIRDNGSSSTVNQSDSYNAQSYSNNYKPIYKEHQYASGEMRDYQVRQNDERKHDRSNLARSESSNSSANHSQNHTETDRRPSIRTRNEANSRASARTENDTGTKSTARTGTETRARNNAETRAQNGQTTRNTSGGVARTNTDASVRTPKSIVSNKPGHTRAGEVSHVQVSTRREIKTGKMRDRISQDTLRKVEKTSKIRVNGKAASSMALKTGHAALLGTITAGAIYSSATTGDTTGVNVAAYTGIRTGRILVDETKEIFSHRKVTKKEKQDKKIYKADQNLDKRLSKYEKTQQKLDALKKAGAEKDVKKLDKKVAELQRRKKEQEYKALKAADKKQKLIIKRKKIDSDSNWLSAIFKRIAGYASTAITVLCAAGVIIFFLTIIIVMMSAVGSKNKSASTMNMTETAMTVYSYLNGKGMDDIHVAAILGNIYQESRMIPDAVQSNGEGIGLFQFSYSQKEDYYNWLDASGLGRANWDVTMYQLEFFYHTRYLTSIAGGDWGDPSQRGRWGYGWWTSASRSRFEAATSLESATQIFYDEYEGANAYGTDNTGADRYAFAQNYLAAIQSKNMLNTDDRLLALFPDGVPTSAAGMSPYLVSIDVNIYTDMGAKTTRVCVHRDLANKVAYCFEEMYKLNFPIEYVAANRATNSSIVYSLFGYNWRYMTSNSNYLSHHSYGVAIDINAPSNPRLGPQNTASASCITADIVQIWKSQGFYWGGDWDASVYDPMHFTWTNH